MRQGRFKVATFNLYNLVLPDVTYYRKRRYSKEQYRAKKAWLIRQLHKMDADIVGFQEVFQREALQKVVAESGQYDKGTLITGEQTGAELRPVVGLVSRFKQIEHQFITHFPKKAELNITIEGEPITRFSRPVLKARLQISPGLTVTVFVLHLKSKRPTLRQHGGSDRQLEEAIGQANALFRRTAEATAIRAILLDTMRSNNEPVILMGDVNDTDTAVTTQMMSGSPPRRFDPHEKRVPIWDVLLYNVKDIQARQSTRDIYYTHLYNGHYESLDQIMVSQEFFHRNRNRRGYVEYVSILNDHLIDETLSNEHIPHTQSDHAQVVATIRLSPGK